MLVFTREVTNSHCNTYYLCTVMQTTSRQIMKKMHKNSSSLSLLGKAYYGYTSIYFYIGFY